MAAAAQEALSLDGGVLAPFAVALCELVVVGVFAFQIDESADAAGLREGGLQQCPEVFGTEPRGVGEFALEDDGIVLFGRRERDLVGIVEKQGHAAVRLRHEAANANLGGEVVQ